MSSDLHLERQGIRWWTIHREHGNAQCLIDGADDEVIIVGCCRRR